MIFFNKLQLNIYQKSGNRQIFRNEKESLKSNSCSFSIYYAFKLYQKSAEKTAFLK